MLSNSASLKGAYSASSSQLIECWWLTTVVRPTKRTLMSSTAMNISVFAGNDSLPFSFFANTEIFIAIGNVTLLSVGRTIVILDKKKLLSVEKSSSVFLSVLVHIYVVVLPRHNNVKLQKSCLELDRGQKLGPFLNKLQILKKVAVL